MKHLYFFGMSSFVSWLVSPYIITFFNVTDKTIRVSIRAGVVTVIWFGLTLLITDKIKVKKKKGKKKGKKSEARRAR